MYVPSFKLHASGAGMTPVEHAVLETLAYFSQFGRALRPLELQELLWNCEVFPSSVHTALQTLAANEYIIIEDFIGLSQHSIHVTRERQELLARRRACARTIAERLQRISGIASVILMNSTAMQTARKESDIDFLILVHPGSLYWARTIAIINLELKHLIKHKRNQAGKACLGYWLSLDNLSVQQYQSEMHTAAYWIATMIPLAGIEGYRQFIEANDWVHDYLPNWLPHEDAHLEELRIRNYELRIMERILYPIHRAKVMMDSEFRNSNELMCTPSTLKLHSIDKRPGYGAKMQSILDICFKKR